MSETVTAPNPAPIESVTPEPTTPAASTFAEASKKYQNAKTWADVGLSAPVVEPEAPAEPVAEATEAATEAAPEASPEAVDAFAGFTVDAENRLHRADGSYANAEEIDAYNATIPAAEPEAPKEPEPIVVKLKARDGVTDVEIEVTDEAVADALRTNAKDGLRGAEYRKKMQAVEEHLAERRAFETMLETNPEGLILQHLPEDKQASLAVALVAKHWDTIAPHLIKFDTDASTRIAEAANAQIRMRDQQREYEQMTAQQKYGVQLESAVRALIPEHINDATTEDFLAVAALDIGNAVKSAGRPIPVEDVPKVLAKRLALYGFDKPASGDASAVPTPAKRPVARAVKRPEGVTASATPTVPVTGADPSKTVRRLVTAQRVAASVPSAGAGAAPIRAPRAAPNESIEQASARLKKMSHW